MTRARDNSNILGTSGTNGQVLTIDTAQNNGYAFENPAQYAAGKNGLINGGMDIWQRGTSFTVNTAIYTADRWVMGGTNYGCTRESTVVPQGFTYSMKLLSTSSTTFYVNQAIESLNAINFAGQVVTLSAYLSGSIAVGMSFAVGWSASVDNAASGTWTYLPAITGTSGTAGSFNRISGQVTIPSTAKSIIITIYNTSAIATGVSVYLAGVQLELGSVATPFSRAGGTVQGELAACQRYYYRTFGATTSTTYCVGHCESTTAAIFPVPLPAPMRTVPTSMDYAGLRVYSGNTVGTTGTFVYTANYSNSSNASVLYTHGSLLFTAGYAAELDNASTGSAYLGFSAEL
jgi:hypothetical protein